MVRLLSKWFGTDNHRGFCWRTNFKVGNPQFSLRCKNDKKPIGIKFRQFANPRRKASEGEKRAIQSSLHSKPLLREKEREKLCRQAKQMSGAESDAEIASMKLEMVKSPLSGTALMVFKLCADECGTLKSSRYQKKEALFLLLASAQYSYGFLWSSGLD